MCAIAGVYHLDRQRSVPGGVITAMCGAMWRRGPDDAGQMVSGNIGIGMRRLSIIGVSDGHQPMSNEDQTLWLVCNGEIYNHLELRTELKRRGHAFRTSSDVECILHLYEEYGPKCVEHLHGMFAFALWDKKANSLFIVRDRLGIKPLFYWLDGHSLVFASELKGILKCPGVTKELDYSALDAFMTYGYIPAPRTIFRHIYKLEPGHSIVCRDKAISIEQYWDLEFHPDNTKPERAFCEEFEALFDETVQMHLMSEVPLGAFLSGGIDSSLTVAFMRKHLHERPRTFTIGFGGVTGSYSDERARAKNVAERYGCDHTSFEVQPRLNDILDSIVEAFDEPFADDSVIPSFYICKLASERLKVALTGLGGDELFGGYNRYLGLKIGAAYDRVPAWCHRLLSGLVTRLPEYRNGDGLSLAKRFIRTHGARPDERYRQFLSSGAPEERRALYSDGIWGCIDREYVEGTATRFFNKSNAEDVLDKAFYQDIKMYLPDDILALSDRLGMWHSLELRVPFVDHKVVEFCATIPSGLKIKLLTNKYLLKKVAAPYISQDILATSKQGFASPMASWMRNDLRSYVWDMLSEDRLRMHGLFRWQGIERMIREHMSRRQDHSKLIFSLLMFQRWCERCMAR